MHHFKGFKHQHSYIRVYLFVGSNFGTTNVTPVWLSLPSLLYVVVFWHCWLFARKCLGFIFNSHLTFSDQISSLFKSCYYHICELRCICPFLNFKCASTIATSIVHSKLDYCNSLYYSLPKSQTNRLQVIQNSLAWVAVKAPKFCHVTPILKSLHWLKINKRIEYKLLSLLPIKLLPLLNLFICTAWSLFSPSPTLLTPHNICCHPFSTTYIFSKNHQSLTSLCITSSLKSTSSLIRSALQNALLMMSHSLIHLPPAHHSYPPSYTVVKL